MSELRTLQVVASRVGMVRRAIERLNRRAVKLGMPEMTLVVSETLEHVKVTVPGGAELAIGVREVTLSGQPPVLPGYRLAAIASRIAGEDGGEVTNLLNQIGDEQVPDSYRTRGLCDHCQTKRTRNTYFIVRKVETGALVQVGSTCVQDFLGGETVPLGALSLYAAAMALLGMEADETEESFRTGRGGEQGFDLRLFLANVALVVEQTGKFVSRGAAYEGGGQATADTAFLVMKAPGQDPNARFFETADAIEAAVDALAAQPGPHSDYEGNLIAAFSLGCVTSKTMGLVASGYVAYDRAKREQANAKLAATSKHVGEVKRRMNLLNLTVRQVKPIDGFYGTSWLVKMTTLDGSVVTTFASNNPDLKEGDLVNVRATVTEHADFRGVKETKVNRAKFEKRSMSVA